MSEARQKPLRALIGWEYNGRWYFWKKSAAFDYWLDLIWDLQEEQLQTMAETGLIPPLARMDIPTFVETLDSL